jgi:hypothetical protein
LNGILSHFFTLKRLFMAWKLVKLLAVKKKHLHAMCIGCNRYWKNKHTPKLLSAMNYTMTKIFAMDNCRTSSQYWHSLWECYHTKYSALSSIWTILTCTIVRNRWHFVNFDISKIPNRFIFEWNFITFLYFRKDVNGREISEVIGSKKEALACNVH